MKRKWYDSRRAASKVLKDFPFGSTIFKKKNGRNKGKYFIGSYIEFINLN